jgi:hypothetical protein
MSYCSSRFFVLAFAAMAGAALASGCDKASTTPSNSNASGGRLKDTAPVKETASAKADFSLTSEQLAKEFETDKGVADAKYKGKMIEVEGPLKDVMISPSGDITFRLVGFKADDGKPGHTICGVPPAAEKEKIKNLTEGQKIKFKGECKGESSGMFVDLLKCEILSIGPDPAISITADQLTQDFAKDQKAAEAKYKDKWLLVEGTVLELAEGNYDSLEVALEGIGKKDGKPLRVSATFSPNTKKDAASLKKGDKVKIKGGCGGEVFNKIRLSKPRLGK